MNDSILEFKDLFLSYSNDLIQLGISKETLAIIIKDLYLFEKEQKLKDLRVSQIAKEREQKGEEKPRSEEMPATPKQISYLKGLGYTGDTTGLTTKTCNILIKDLLKTQ